MKLYPKLVKKTFMIKENGLGDYKWLGNAFKPGWYLLWSPKEGRDSTSIDLLKKGAFMELKGKKDSSSKRSTPVGSQSSKSGKRRT